MLQAIRDKASGWIAYTIIILLCIPFALWGINSYLGGGATPDVAEVDGTAVTPQAFQRAYQRQLAQLRSMMGANFDPAQLNEERLKQQVLQQLVNETVLAQTSRDAGLSVSNRQLDATIRSLPAFQQEGRFDAARYERLLLQQGYTPPAFEQNLRESLLTEQLQQGLAQTAFVSDAALKHYLALQHQQRRLSYLVLSLDHYRQQVEITDKDIQQYYDNNKDQFQSPERVKLQYLELTLDQIAKDITVSEADLRAAYEERKSQYTRPEERRASHILVQLPEHADPQAVAAAEEQARKIYQQIESGETSFDQMLQQAADMPGVEGGDLGLISKGMMEPAFEDSLFALKNQGDVSEPVRTQFGFHIIRLDGIVAGEVTPFEQVRDELAQELRRRRAEPEFFDASETLANLSFENPDSLQPAADALGLPLQQTDWIDRQGGEEGIARFPKVVQAAFSPDVLDSRLNSEALEVEPSHVLVIRVMEHQSAAPLALEQARDQIVEQLGTEKAREALQTELDSLLERARAGESLAQLAQASGGRLEQPGLVERSASGLDGSLLNSAFQLPEPQAETPSYGTARLANGDRALIAVSEVIPGDPAAFDTPQRAALRQRLASRLGSEQFRSYVASRRQQADVRMFPDRL